MYEQALTKQTSTLFEGFAKFNGFYLAGGTALALQIGHRLSVDFDWFTSQDLPRDLLQKTKRTFSACPISVTYRSLEQLNVLICGIQTTFFQYPYPVIGDFVSHRGLALASVQEIAAMKAFSIGKRLSYKDYVDWYFLLKEKHVKLQDVIVFCQKKFGGDFNDKLFLGQLVSMEDIPTQKIDFLRDPIERHAVQKFLVTADSSFKL